MNYKLIISIVPQNYAETIHNVSKSTGAGGGSIILGRGTSQNNFVQLLGLGDTSKELVYVVCKDYKAKGIIQAIKDSTNDKKSNFGYTFSIKVPDFYRAAFLDKNQQLKEEDENSLENQKNIEEFENSQNEGENMTSQYQMINVIVNKGYAEDAMAAARKAGATGGTIISARGTAKEGDAQFFGMTIVPEKDMLIILVPTEQKNDILNAITSLSCFSQAGSGIVFCNEVNDFTILGKK